ncbi:MAG: RNA 2',3'-cyclic phosphodiesterase [bacterium]|nr:RNA 2',3'-cyclic phosphodiesterase [bacterium]
MSQTIRAFIAIELPDSIKSLIGRVQQELKSLGLKARWVRAENIHLTLKFLGDIDAGDIDNIGRAMADTAADRAPLALRIGGIGFFPGIKRPRVVWVGLGGEIPNLLNLQRNLEDRLATVGFAKEKRSFKAHLTLGRIRQAANPDTARRIIKEYIELGDHQFTADRITLIQSVLKPSGAVYSPLKETELRNE